MALAVFSQLVTPTMHASRWAQSSGQGLLYAFCGTLSPALIAKMREIAPEGLLDHGDTPAAQTELCLSIGSLASAFILASVLVLLLFLQRPQPCKLLRPAPSASRRCPAYHSRAPPCPA